MKLIPDISATAQADKAAKRRKNMLLFSIINSVSFFALFLHLGFIALFHFMGLEALATFNLFSVLIWALAIYLNFSGKHSACIQIVCLEVLTHAFLATAYLGLEAGFQHYVWAVAALAVVNHKMRVLHAGLFSFGLTVCFAGLYLLYADVSYLGTFSQHLPWLHFANALIAGSFLSAAIAAALTASKAQEKRLSKQASSDMLTGLYNRRHSDRLISDLIQTPGPHSLIIADLDNFKNINDSFGHQVGDQVLLDIAQRLKKQNRGKDVIARWGGEEFLIFLPNTDQQQAYQLAEQLRLDIYQHCQVPAINLGAISMSFGVAQWRVDLSFERNFCLADAALYQSKQQGRNIVSLAPQAA